MKASELGCEITAEPIGFLGFAATYVYNADGRRVRKTTNGVVSDYVCAVNGDEAAVVDGSRNWIRSEVYAGGRHWATSIGSGATYHHFVDHLGTERVRATVLSSGTWVVCETITSLPFGDWQTISNAGCGDPSPMHFTGQEHDSESGNDNFGARYYSSSLGRFTTPDPSGGHFMNPQSLNRYAYVRNNPLNMIDPTGLDCVYTDNLNRDGTVGVEGGDCSYNNGTYVNGTIDTSSFNLTQSDNGYSLNFGFTGYDTGTYTLSGFSLPGFSSGSLDPFFFNQGFGLGQPIGALNSAATQIFSQVYQNTRAVTNPANIALFYGASALAGSLGAVGAGLVSTSGVPTSIVEGIAPDPVLDSLLQAGRSLGQNPDFLGLLSDIAQGYTPGPVTATLGGFIGAVLSEVQSHWPTITNYVRANVSH